ncbi:MAG: ArdC family protein [Lentimicrobium sp.]|nr:ArdC family protein [Lentimicrobium sp.]
MSAKDKVIEIRKKLASLPAEDRQEFVSRVGSVVTIEGRALSSHNTELCVFQYPEVTIVGGFQQWRKAGRQVRKGEHGLAIWVPAISKPKEGEPEATETDPYFFGGTVFDITQTEELLHE